MTFSLQTIVCKTTTLTDVRWPKCSLLIVINKLTLLQLVCFSDCAVVSVCRWCLSGVADGVAGGILCTTLQLLSHTRKFWPKGKGDYFYRNELQKYLNENMLFECQSLPSGLKGGSHMFACFTLYLLQWILTLTLFHSTIKRCPVTHFTTRTWYTEAHSSFFFLLSCNFVYLLKTCRWRLHNVDKSSHFFWRSMRNKAVTHCWSWPIVLDTLLNQCSISEEPHALRARTLLSIAW